MHALYRGDVCREETAYTKCDSCEILIPGTSATKGEGAPQSIRPPIETLAIRHELLLAIEPVLKGWRGQLENNAVVGPLLELIKKQTNVVLDLSISWTRFRFRARVVGDQSRVSDER
jgi:hypothetical protein